ncbi:hypothetical protein [Amycolatopsis sp. NPDC051371]|uniref:phage tail protein n=1 Tax=Amycolatopsis sp. NPDC051371 TaxID=3155800 RepID=UPI00341BB394
MPPPPRARAKLPALTVDPATTTAPAAVKERPPQRKPDPLPPSNAAALATLRAGDKKPLADPSRKESQDKVGNGAVAAGLARSPGTDPKFAVLKKDVAQKKRTVAKSHPPANKEATSAQAASVPPKDDEVAQGKTANAEKMNEAKPKEFDKEAFIKAVEKAIAEKAPKNLEEADDFAGSGKPAEVKAEVQGKVGEGKTDSAEQIADTTAAPPDTSAAEVKQVVPMAADRPPGTPGTPDPAKATPDKLPPSATDLSAGPASVDKEMADNQVTEKQMATDPAFSPALKDKKTAEKHSEATPPELRKNESQQLRQTTAQAKHFGAAAMGAITNRRVGTGRQVDGGKKNTKTTDEEKRTRVTAILQKVFDTMKTDVEGILTGLDKLVDDQFTKGEKEARDAFTAEHRQKMDEYKDKRYSGGWGLVKWGHDKLFGLPEEANQIFVEARDHYVKRMRGVISAVADTIGRELTRAKQRIATGRSELQKAVDSLPKDLKALGKEAAAGFADKFDELTQSVDDKSTELVDTLATKYTDAVKSVDAEIAVEKEKNKGLVDKALDAVKGVIKTILELKDMLLGVLAKAAQAVMAIIKDPIGFLGNLVSAVGGGLKQFKNNAVTHLQQGVLSWLLGTAATAGIELPKSFDVVSILLLIASLIGLSWANLRARLAKKLPKEAMTAIEAGEHALPIILEVRKRGIRALWDDLKTRVGDLKKNLIDNLVSFLLPTIIIAGITWIISLFNPASAFIRACKMIIDIIKFIVTNGRQILEFVNTVLDAVIAIAKGGAGGVAGLVEKALARSIPVLIGALAALLGVGGIAGKVKEVFQKLAKPVNKAIDWVIDKIVGLAKKVWAKIKALAKKLKDKFSKKKPGDKPRKPFKDRLKEKLFGGDDSPEGQQKRLKKGLAAARSAAKRVKRTGGVMEKILRGVFTVIRVRYRMTSLEPVLKDGHWKAVGTVNPTGEIDLGIDAPAAGPLTEEDEKSKEAVKVHLPGRAASYITKVLDSWWASQLDKAKLWPGPQVLGAARTKGTGEAATEGFLDKVFRGYFKGRKTKPDKPNVWDTEVEKGTAFRHDLVGAIGKQAESDLRPAAVAFSKTSDKNAEYAELAFYTSQGKFGEFEPLPMSKEKADPDLLKAVQTAGGVVAFLKLLARGGSSEGVDYTKFIEIWNAEGASKQWIKTQFRNADKGKHEWIPTSYLGDVLTAAADQRTKSVLPKKCDIAEDWVTLQHELRSYTAFVFWKIEVAKGSTEVGDRAVEAHVGGWERDGNPIFNGRDDFWHKSLKTLFDNFVSSTPEGTPAQFLTEVMLSNLDAGKLMWNGKLGHIDPSLHGLRINAEYKMVKVDATGLKLETKRLNNVTIDSLGEMQRTNFGHVRMDFLQARAKLKVK